MENPQFTPGPRCQRQQLRPQPKIPSIVEGFRLAARNAIASGFDGVEVHAANGYLLDQFLRDGSNQRSGPYGGSMDNRARLLREVLEAVAAATPLMGLRLSPLNGFNDIRDSDPIGLARWLPQQLNQLSLDYQHVIRANCTGVQQGDLLTPMREQFRGVHVADGGYSADEANAAIGAGQVNAVAFGTPFRANPDTFYSPGPEGYTDDMPPGRLTQR
jgi:N-ethylmaleimide reductase